jgi:hypothetical protein
VGGTERAYKPPALFPPDKNSPLFRRGPPAGISKSEFALCRSPGRQCPDSRQSPRGFTPDPAALRRGRLARPRADAYPGIARLT